MTSTTGTKTRLDAGHGMVRTRAFKLLACLVAHALVNLQLQWPSCCVDGAAHAPTPLPPVQTAEQKRIIGQIQSTARVQSQAAKGGLLAVLASAGFKSLLAPELRPLSAAALWQRYTDELQFVEMAHGFPANNNATQNNALDLDIDIASEMSFFPNQWQLPILYPQRELQVKAACLFCQCAAVRYVSSLTGNFSFLLFLLFPPPPGLFLPPFCVDLCLPVSCLPLP